MDMNLWDKYQKSDEQLKQSAIGKNVDAYVESVEALIAELQADNLRHMQRIEQLEKVIKEAKEQKPVGYVVIGQGISFYKTTKEEADYQANSLKWRDDKCPEIHPVYRMPAVTKEQKEIWFRRVDLPGYPEGSYLIASYKGAGDVGPFYAAPIPVQSQAVAVPDGYIHVSEFIGLCKDFSSRTGSIYIGDVESAINGLLYSESSSNNTEQAAAAPDAVSVLNKAADGIENQIVNAGLRNDLYDAGYLRAIKRELIKLRDSLLMPSPRITEKDVFAVIDNFHAMYGRYAWRHYYETWIAKEGCELLAKLNHN